MLHQQMQPRGEVEQHLRNLRIRGANYLVTGDLLMPSPATSFLAAPVYTRQQN